MWAASAQLMGATQPLLSGASTSPAASFDDLVSAGEKGRRDREAEHFRGFEVDDELEFGRLLDGQLGRVGALQELVHESRGAPRGLRETRAVPPALTSSL